MDFAQQAKTNYTKLKNKLGFKGKDTKPGDLMSEANVRASAAKEAEGIFKKTNPKMADRYGNFPKTGPSMPSAYNAEAKRIEDQVTKTRLNQAKAKKDNFHTGAQTFITGAKKLGMTVKAEGGELIAYPKKKTIKKSK